MQEEDLYVADIFLRVVELDKVQTLGLGLHETSAKALLNGAVLSLFFIPVWVHALILGGYFSVARMREERRMHPPVPAATTQAARVNRALPGGQTQG